MKVDPKTGQKILPSKEDKKENKKKAKK